MKKLFKKLALMVVALLTFSVGSNYTVKEVKAADSTPVATFDFGANSSAEHVDGNSLGTSKNYTSGTYTLSLTSMANVYGPAYDAKGNSCIKLGTSKKAGSFAFTVKDDVDNVIIHTAAYKANSATVTINGKATSLTKKSNNGEYDAITVDTSSTKTVNFAVTSGYRCMINTIEFFAGETSGEEKPSILITTDITTLYIDKIEETIVNVATSNADGYELSWNSSDNTVATVEDGVVTAVSAGSTTITAVLSNGTDTYTSNEIEINVYDYTEEINIDDYTLLNKSTLSGITTTASANQTFECESVGYNANYFYSYYSSICPTKGQDSYLLNLTKYANPISQIVIEEYVSSSGSQISNLVVLESLDGSTYSEVEMIEGTIYNGTSNINVAIYNFSGNTNYFKLFYPSSATSYLNINNVWVEFVERCTVTFDVNGGDDLAISSFNVRSGESIDVSTPTRNGYTFKGWKNGETILSTETLIVNESVNYIAQWESSYSKIETLAQLDFGYNYTEGTSRVITAAYTGGTTSNMNVETNNNNNEILGLDSNWTVTAYKGGSNNAPGLNKSNDFRLYHYNQGQGNYLVFKNESVNITSITINYTSSSYSGASVFVNENEVTGSEGYYVINSNTFTISNNNKSSQIRISSIEITVGTPNTYDSFNNVNIKYSAIIPTELFADVESFGFNIAVGSKNMDYPVDKTTVDGDNTAFSLVLTNITDYKSVITVTGYVVVDGERVNLGSKSYSVESMIQYYLDYASDLKLLSTQIEVLKAFQAEIA